MKIDIDTIRRTKGIGKKVMQEIINNHLSIGEDIDLQSKQVNKQILTGMDLFNEDCLSILRAIEDDSIDLILTDPPYGTTACNWDSVIPLYEMWRELNRVVKDEGHIVLFSAQPFTTMLVHSNIENFKYHWIWEKNFSTNFLHAKRQPLRKHEEILVFCKGTTRYNPIKTDGHIPTRSAKGSSNGKLYHGKNTRDYEGGDTTRFPTSVLNFVAVDPKKRVHPTQKPIDLLEYLIETYSNEGDVVLDFTMGSGSTGVACKNLNRKFIGIELDAEYFDIAYKRINE